MLVEESDLQSKATTEESGEVAAGGFREEVTELGLCRQVELLGKWKGRRRGGALRPKLGRWEGEWPVWGEREEQGKSWNALGAVKVKVGAAWSVLASHPLVQ